MGEFERGRKFSLAFPLPFLICRRLPCHAGYSKTGSQVFFSGKTGTFSTYPLFLGYFQINTFSKFLVSLQLTSRALTRTKAFSLAGDFRFREKKCIVNHPWGLLQSFIPKGSARKGWLFQRFQVYERVGISDFTS